MAEKEEEYTMGSAQEIVLTCEKHDSMPIDVTCEDCDEFICTKCVREDHKDHNWDTIQTAATLKTRGLLKSMKEIEEKDIQNTDKRIHSLSQQMEENKERYEMEVSRIQRHYDAIVEKLGKLKEKHEKTLRESLESKNLEVSQAKSSLEEKKRQVLRYVNSLKENSSMMTNIMLLKTHRELTKLLSTEEEGYTLENSKYFLRYESGDDINEAVLESMMGQTLDTSDVRLISVTEADSFKWGKQPITVLEAINEETCLIKNRLLDNNVQQVHKSGKKEKQFSAKVTDVCVTYKNEMYATEWKKKCISLLSPSEAVSIVFSTDPLQPGGICQTMDGDLLVTLTDEESDSFQPNSSSQRLVRHVTLTGDVIRDYEYQEDGQTRLFTVPRRVTQNANTDICVINETTAFTGELLILSFSGSLKSVYPEQDQREEFIPKDVVCDSHCNIIVSDTKRSSVHLLSPEGRFLRYLLTENQVNRPYAMSLRHSTLWIGDLHGLVKVFRYKLKTQVQSDTTN